MTQLDGMGIDQTVCICASLAGHIIWMAKNLYGRFHHRLSHQKSLPFSSFQKIVVKILPFLLFHPWVSQWTCESWQVCRNILLQSSLLKKLTNRWKKSLHFIQEMQLQGRSQEYWWAWEFFQTEGTIIMFKTHGILFPGILFPDILFPGILFPGILFPGILFPGILFRTIWR